MIIVVQQMYEYYMQIIKASELLNSIGDINNTEFEREEDIRIDFLNVHSVDLKAINKLLNIQKVILLNNKNLSLSNVNPRVRQMLEITGLLKTYSENIVNSTKV